jgi:hypothetical protein
MPRQYVPLSYALLGKVDIDLLLHADCMVHRCHVAMLLAIEPSG